MGAAGRMAVVLVLVLALLLLDFNQWGISTQSVIQLALSTQSISFQYEALRRGGQDEETAVASARPVLRPSLLWYPAGECTGNHSREAADLLRAWRPLPLSVDEEPCVCGMPRAAPSPPRLVFLEEQEEEQEEEEDQQQHGPAAPADQGDDDQQQDAAWRRRMRPLNSSVVVPDGRGVVRVLVGVEGGLMAQTPSCADLLRAFVTRAGGAGPPEALELRYVSTSPVAAGLHVVEFSGWETPGDYQLEVYVDWSSVYPERGCSGASHAWCRHCWPRHATRQTLLVQVGPQHVSAAPPPAARQQAGEEQAATGGAGAAWGSGPCRDLASMLHGRWLHVQGGHPMGRYYTRAFAGLPAERHSVFWQPYTCWIPAYTQDQIRAALGGHRVHFMGDSTMHELLRHVLAYSHSGHPDEWPLWPDCDRNNRYFPPWTSPATNATFSFSWLGGPGPCDNSLGLRAVLADIQAVQRLYDDAQQQRPPEGQQEEAQQQEEEEEAAEQEEADDEAGGPESGGEAGGRLVVVVNSGLHDLPRPPSPPLMSMAQYHRNLRRLLHGIILHDWGMRPEHVVLKTTTPLLGQMTCSDDDQLGTQARSSRPAHEQQSAANNAAISWMNKEADEVARGAGVPVLEVFGLIQAEDVLLDGRMDDGSHCHGRPSCSYQAVILLHHIVNTLLAGADGAGGRHHAAPSWQEEGEAAEAGDGQAGEEAQLAMG